MGKQTELPSGRVVIDDRGNSVWEWRNADGTYSRITDTQRLRTLEIENYTLVETSKQKQPDFTSYYGLGTEPAPEPGEKKSTRRSLDDMRKLSEEIKRKRAAGELPPGAPIPPNDKK